MNFYTKLKKHKALIQMNDYTMIKITCDGAGILEHEVLSSAPSN